MKTTDTTPLDGLAADLGRASAQGARIATATVATGKLMAQTGINRVTMPGPALRTVLAAHTGRAGGSADGVPPEKVPAIADRMAAVALKLAARAVGGKH